MNKALSLKKLQYVAGMIVVNPVIAQTSSSTWIFNKIFLFNENSMKLRYSITYFQCFRFIILLFWFLIECKMKTIMDLLKDLLGEIEEDVENINILPCI